MPSPTRTPRATKHRLQATIRGLEAQASQCEAPNPQSAYASHPARLLPTSLRSIATLLRTHLPQAPT